MGYLTTQVYDDAGQRIALVDARGNRTTFQYDAAGRQTLQLDPLARRTTFQYDDAGQQTVRTDARGVVTTYSYDEAGRLKQRSYLNDPPVTLSYDADGNRKTLVDGTGTTTYTYDELSRATNVVNPLGKMVTYAFNSLGQRSSLTEPNGGVITYSYDEAGHTQFIASPYSTLATTLVHDAAGNNVQRVNYGNVIATHTYDTAGRLVRIYNGNSSGTVPFSIYTYTYDNVGNRSSVVKAGGDRTTWTYDNAYQLTNESRGGANAYNTSYAYDPVGNRLVKNDSGALTTSTYDVANQLTTLVDGSGVTTFTYDAAGNLQLQQAPAGGLTTYAWNDENQRTRVALPSGLLNTSTYNGDGLRSQKQDSSGVANFVWDGQNYLSEYDASGVRTQLYLQTPDTYGLLIARKRSTLLLPECYYHDATGSVTAIATSGSTTPNAKYLYKAFGETTLISGASTSPAFLWIGGLGYYFDADLLDYYLRARTYNPVQARFLSLDPIGFQAGDINFYRYVLNNAINGVDPSGRLPLCIKPCYFIQNPKYDNTPNGCGSDNGLGSLVPNYPSGINFKPCCDAHDICYGTCGASKVSCDIAFAQCMARICARYKDKNPEMYRECKFWNTRYYEAVKNRGQGAYDDAQNGACLCVCECPIQVTA